MPEHTDFDGSGFERFLQRAVSEPPRHGFCGRNFLLDEGPSASRWLSYQPAMSDHASFDLWETEHNAYLLQHVQLARRGGGLGQLDAGDALTCPATFRDIPDDSPFLASDDRSHLLRVERLSFIARSAGEDEGLVRELCQRQLGLPKGQVVTELTDLLDAWAEQLDEWPTFGGYWDNLSDLFGRTPAEDPADWANRLRDRLGLVHLQPDPPDRPLEIVVFKYPISRVRKLRNNRRPLVPPTVLDGRLNPAFCPAPRGERYGRAVSLEDADPPALVCEVVHPVPQFRAADVYRVGQITQTVSDELLTAARARHMLHLRQLPGRSEYAVDIDG